MLENPAMKQLQPVIGLEVHVELATKSKMFCGCPAEHFGIEPNTHTCPVCLGLPGALPVPNKKAIEWTILLALALNCQINPSTKFDRKNYFYPDLPKGYQISQYDEPIAINGTLQNIGIRRVHLEEDTGKLQHTEINGEKVSLVDFNRSGVPLVEIVTEPDFRQIDQVDAFLKELQRTIRYLGISGADMEKGSMRLEPSISVRELGQSGLPGYRVELKNINSFRFARKALEYEIARQTSLIESGEKPTQETRGWSETQGATVLQRTKEEAHDYRYFPEPDIPPLVLDHNLVSTIKNTLPELPAPKAHRFQQMYGLTDYAANILVDDLLIANYFEEAVRVGGDPKETANWLVNKRVDVATVLPAQLVELQKASKAVTSLSVDQIDELITKAIKNFPQAVKDFKSGKGQAIGVLIGAIVKTHPQIDKTLLKDRLIFILQNHA